MTSPFSTIEEAIQALRAGKMIVLVDDEHRENEGDLVIGAQFADADSINFMAKFGRGLICLPMEAEMVERLGLPMMTSSNRSPFGTAFTVSIEAAQGVTTGISAKDRAWTIKRAIDPKTGPLDIISPGHIFPLRANPKGVLARAGQTEGSVDLMRLAGLTPAAVICEVINDDGTMSRINDLVTFAKQHHILFVSIHDLIEYRILHENLLEVVATSRLPIEGHGDFTMMLFENEVDECEHFALLKPRRDEQVPPLVRIHSECITGDVFGSCKCDCGKQLEQSLSYLANEGGVLIYMRQEGRGVGLANKIKAYSLQDDGLDTVEANEHLGLPVDNRNYAMAFQILKHLGMMNIRLLTNNPFKIAAMEHYGITVCERISVLVPPTAENKIYLRTKQQKLGHYLSISDEK
jgi:3,4-dihydroxy 2-butanone 4-phosphate synthase/GTP cyclohydrolase II